MPRSPYPYTRSASKKKAKLFDEMVQFVKKAGTMEFHGICHDSVNNSHFTTFSRGFYKVNVFRVNDNVRASFFSTGEGEDNEKIYNDAESFKKDFEAYFAEHCGFDVKPDMREIFNDIIAYVEKQKVAPITSAKKYRDFVDFTTVEGCIMSISIYKDRIYCGISKNQSIGGPHTDLKTFKKDFEALFTKK